MLHKLWKRKLAHGYSNVCCGKKQEAKLCFQWPITMYKAFKTCTNYVATALSLTLNALKSMQFEKKKKSGALMSSLSLNHHRCPLA